MGRCRFGTGGVSGSLAGNVTNDGSLVFNRAGVLTYGGAISGSGSATLSGSGTVILTGSNSYAGGTEVSAGLLRFNGTGPVPASGLITVANGGYVGASSAAWGNDVHGGFLARLNASHCEGVIGLESDVTGAVDMTAFGTGARVGSAATATLSGTLTPKNSTYRVGGGGGELTISSNLGDSGGVTTLEMNTSGSLPAGTILLTGNSSYSGGTTLGAGTLNINADSALGAAAGSVIFSGDATLRAGSAVVDLGVTRGIASSASAQREPSTRRPTSCPSPAGSPAMEVWRRSARAC